MAPRPADIRCDRVWKIYRLRHPRRPSTAGSTHGRFWRRHAAFAALRDVSFEVARAETLGVVGLNGAGKSTLLKLMSGITAPTSGEIAISGRLGTLIEIGSGFHPELTGQENLYLSGAILGLRRRDVSARLEQIVEFSGIGSFLDVPVKQYSSGMCVRLGFALAAHVDADVLLIDEVLSVGDMAYQARCLGRIQELKEAGTTVVFISHDLAAVERISDRVLLLHDGQVMALGEPIEVVERYQALATGEPSRGVEGRRAPVAIRSVTLHRADGAEIVTARTRTPLVVRIAYESAAECRDLVAEVYFYAHGAATPVAHCTTDGSAGPLDLAPGAGAVECVVPDLLLQAGRYTIGATLRHRDAEQAIAWSFERAVLYVEGARTLRSSVLLPHEWRHIRAAPGIDRPGLVGISARDRGALS